MSHPEFKGSVSQKLRPSMHHSKALPLSIVRGPFSQSFIKGICRNLCLKILAFSEHFPLIFAVYFEEIVPFEV